MIETTLKLNAEDSREPGFASAPISLGCAISPWVFAVRNSRAQRNRTLPPILAEPSASCARLGLSQKTTGGGSCSTHHYNTIEQKIPSSFPLHASSPWILVVFLRR